MFKNKLSYKEEPVMLTIPLICGQLPVNLYFQTFLTWVICTLQPQKFLKTKPMKLKSY